MNDDCNVWIWNDADHAKNPNKCWMKKAATEPTVGQANDIHRISGPKVYFYISIDCTPSL